MKTVFILDGKSIFSWQHDGAIPVTGNVVMINRTKYLVTGVLFDYDEGKIKVMVL